MFRALEFFSSSYKVRYSAPGFPARYAEAIACAAFIKESRMNFANADQLHRKSSGIQLIWPKRGKHIARYCGVSGFGVTWSASATCLADVPSACFVFR
jgi:hypothetical protein